MSQCQVHGCGQPATHRYLYRYEPSEGHSVPVHSDVCAKCAEWMAPVLDVLKRDTAHVRDVKVVRLEETR